MDSSAFFLIFIPCLLVNAAALMALLFGPMRKPGSPLKEAGGAILFMEAAFLAFLLIDFYVKYLSKSLFGIDFVVNCLAIEDLPRISPFTYWGIALVYVCQYVTIFAAGRVFLTLMGRGRDARTLGVIGIALAALAISEAGSFIVLRNIYSGGGDPRALMFATMAINSYVPAAVLIAFSILFVVGWLRKRRSIDPIRRSLGDALGAILLAYYPILFLGVILLERILPSWRSTPLALLMAGPYLESFAASLVFIAFAIRQNRRTAARDPQTVDEALAARLDSMELTPREREIVRLVLRGYSNKEISVRLGISPGTVKNHVFRLFRKLGVKNRFELNKFRYETELAGEPAIKPQ